MYGVRVAEPLGDALEENASQDKASFVECSAAGRYVRRAWITRWLWWGYSTMTTRVPYSAKFQKNSASERRRPTQPWLVRTFPKTESGRQ